MFGARRARAACLLFGLLFSPLARAEDLSLARALKIARQRAPEIKVARARLAAANAAIEVARAPYYPQLVGNGTGSYTALGESAAVLPPRTTPVSIVNYTTAAIAGGALRWTLFDFGRTANAVDAAEAGKDASVADAANTEAQLLDTVANAFLDVVYDEKIRDIQRSIVEDRERSIQIVKGLVKQGLAPAVDELRAQSRVYAARRDLELAEAQLVEARVGLLAFLGLDAKSVPAFVVPRLPKPRIETDTAIREAETRRPSVLSARAVAAQGEANVSSTRSRYYPSLALNGDASYRIAKLDVFDQWLPTRTATGALVLTIPLYDASNGARLDAAKAEAERTEAVYDLARRDARTEAARVVVVLATNERVLEQARKAAEASTAVLTVIRARYLQGLSSTLDQIEAESSDAEARLASVRAERAVEGATVRLYTATGRSRSLYETP